MAETHELRLKINAGAAKSGAREFTSALNSIKRAVRDLERDSTGVFLKLKKGITDVTGANGKLKIGVDKQTIRDIDSMAKKQASLAKSISTTTTNSRDANKVVGLLARSYGRATTSGDAFEKSLRSQNSALLRQIQLVGQLRSQLGALKGASANVNVNTGTGNTSRAIAANAIGSAAARAGSHQVGHGTAAWQVEREMRSIAGAANAKDAAIRRATGGMRGLENAFSSTYQVGSAFRVMLGTLTFGSFISSVYQAGDALSQFRVSMEVATGSASGAMQEMDYVDEIAMRLGVNLQSARDNYSKFAISADIAGVSADKTQKIFESVSTAMSVLGKSTMDQNLAFMALEQMMSKGKVSSEELRRQLGERLPGAVSMMAEALGVGVDQLQDMLKAGEINSADALPKFADVLLKRFAPGVEKAALRAGNNLQKLQTQITKFFEAVAESGVMDELAYQFRRLTDALKAGAADGAAQKFGEAFTKMAEMGGNAILWLVENFDKLGAVIKGLAIAAVISRVGLMAQAFTTAGTQMAGYVNVLAVANARRKLEAATLATSTAATKANAAAQGAAALQISGIGRAAGTARIAMVGLTRGLALLGPVAAVVGAGIALWPALFGKAEQSATQMGIKIDAAIARSGVKFGELGDSIHQTAKQAALATIVEDLHILENALDSFSSRKAGRISQLRNVGKGRLERLDGLDPNAGMFQGLTDRWGTLLGVGKYGAMDGEDGMTSGALQANKELVALYEKVANGQATTLDLQNKITESMKQFPSGIPIFSAWRELNRELQMTERAIQANKDRMTEVFGTSEEKSLKEFSQMASDVFTSKDGRTGMDALAKRGAELARVSTTAAAGVSQIMTNLERATRMGMSASELANMNRKTYSGTADEMARLRNEIALTEKAHQAALNTFRAPADAMSGYMTQLASDGVVGGDYAKTMSRWIASYQDQGTRTVDSGAFDVMAVGAMTDAQRTYAATVRDAFNALQPFEQTMGNLDAIMMRASSTFRGTGLELAQVQSALVDVAQGGDESVVSLTEMVTYLKGMGQALNLTGPAADAWDILIAQFTEAATAVNDTGNAANAAVAKFDSAGGSIQYIGDAAQQAITKVNAFKSALAEISKVAAGVNEKADKFVAEMRLEAMLKAMPVYLREGAKAYREAEAAANAQHAAAVKAAQGQADSASLIAFANAQRTKALNDAAAAQERMNKAAKDTWATKEWDDPTKSKGGKRDKTDAQKYADLMTQVKDDLDDIEISSDAYKYLADGMFQTSEAAELMAKAMAYGGGAVDSTTEALIRQIDAATLANEALEKLANDPVKDWLKSANSWVEGSQKIKMDGVESLSDAIHEFIMTGKFDFQNFATSILSSMARVLADKITAQFVEFLGGLGGGGSGGGGTGVFGFLGTLFGFSEGGYSDRPGMTKHTVPLSAFKNAPQYAEGTANTSNGIPSILHPNEAVVPLTRGRKIPVDIGDSGKGGGNNLTVINHINVEGGGENDAELATQIAKRIEETVHGIVDTRMAEGMQYGGVMNPRGGM